MVEPIEVSEAQEYGVENNHRRMPNGEKRFGLSFADGSAYARTEASPGGGAWQDSHYHTAIQEMYIVQKGSVVFAELENGKLKLTKMEAGDYYVSRPGVPHNVYLSANTAMHTVKYGQTDISDWIASPELDGLTKPLFSENNLS